MAEAACVPVPPCIAHGIGDVAEIANPATVARASMRYARLERSQAKASPGALTPLASVAVDGWRALADHAVEGSALAGRREALTVRIAFIGQKGIPATFGEHARLMYDLQALGFLSEGAAEVPRFLSKPEVIGFDLPGPAVWLPTRLEPYSFDQV